MMFKQGVNSAKTHNDREGGYSYTKNRSLKELKIAL
jgi:hypothetical protein